MKKIYASMILVLVLACCACGETTKSLSLAGGNATELKEQDSGVEGIAREENESSEAADVEEQEEELSEFEKLFAEGPLLVHDENNMVGYIDINGNYVVPPRFSDGKRFYEGYAAVLDAETSKWGYIDTAGNYVISPIYEEASRVYNGTAIVNTDYTLCGLIDISGQYIIEPKYREVSFYKDGYALVQYKDDSSGEMIYHFVDESGNLVFDNYSDAYLFDGGIAVVRLPGSCYYCMLKDNGDQMVFEDSPVSFNVSYRHVEYSELNRYLDLKNIVTASSDAGGMYRIGENGKTVSPIFDYISSSNSDLFSAGQRNEYGAVIHGYVDSDFNWVIPPVYDTCSEFIGDYAWVVEELDYERTVELANVGDIYASWYIIDKQGNRVLDGSHLKHNGIGISMAELTMRNLFEHPLPAYDYNTQTHGYVDRDYQVVLPFIYDAVSGFAYDGSYATVKYNGLYGLLDSSGSWLIEPRYHSIGNND